MYASIGQGGFGAAGYGYGGYGNRQLPSPHQLIQFREMVQGQGHASQGLPSPFGNQFQSNMAQHGFSPLQSLLSSNRSQSYASFPGANLNQEQRQEIRDHVLRSFSDGQVTDQEKQQLFQKLQSFRQDSGGAWAGIAPQFGSYGSHQSHAQLPYLGASNW